MAPEKRSIRTNEPVTAVAVERVEGDRLGQRQVDEADLVQGERLGGQRLGGVGLDPVLQLGDGGADGVGADPEEIRTAGQQRLLAQPGEMGGNLIGQVRPVVGRRQEIAGDDVDPRDRE